MDLKISHEGNKYSVYVDGILIGQYDDIVQAAEDVDWLMEEEKEAEI